MSNGCKRRWPVAGPTARVGLGAGPAGPQDVQKTALSASADGGIGAGCPTPTDPERGRPRWEVVDLALPSVEDQNLDGALAAEPRHHRLRADLACPPRHQGPGHPRPVRYVRLPV